MIIDSVKIKPEKRFFSCLEIKETRCLLISDKEKALKKAAGSIKKTRKEIEEYTKLNPLFLHSLTPLSLSLDEIKTLPKIIGYMVSESRKANVGPMASVAGAIADFAVNAMLKEEAKLALVENGGEVSIYTERPVNILLGVGNHLLSKKIVFQVDKGKLGIATSSGVYGHALSFGEAEAVTIFAKNSCLADAAATAAANKVSGLNVHKAIIRGITTAKKIKGVQGCIIIYRNKVGLWGNLPKILKAVGFS